MHEIRRIRPTSLIAILVLCLPVPFATTMAMDRASVGTRSLSFYHTHTGKTLDVQYYANGQYVPEELDRINSFLSDFRTGDLHAIDPGALDILFRLSVEVNNTASVYEVISGYRSPKTNEMLRKTGGGGVARKSQHLLGKAIDVRLRGTNTRTLYKAAKSLALGGVGYYLKSDFIHVDTGRIRSW